MEGTPWSCAVLCCCCCHLPPPTPPESALVARVCWSPGSHSFAALDLVQLQHLVGKICKERRGEITGKERKGSMHRTHPSGLRRS